LLGLSALATRPSRRRWLQAALQIADRAYVMELGELILSGSATDIASNQRVAASYLGFQHEGASGI
jgi:branched-chain amino acid transport system ATP-binding protein